MGDRLREPMTQGRCRHSRGQDRGRREAGGERAEMRINAEGHVVAPGFIDIHSHSDNSLLVTVLPRRIGIDDRGFRKTLEIQP